MSRIRASICLSIPPLPVSLALINELPASKNSPTEEAASLNEANLLHHFQQIVSANFQRKGSTSLSPAWHNDLYSQSCATFTEFLSLSSFLVGFTHLSLTHSQTTAFLVWLQPLLDFRVFHGIFVTWVSMINPPRKITIP